MLQRFSNLRLPLGHRCDSSHLAGRHRGLPASAICWAVCCLTLGLTCKVHAQQASSGAELPSAAPSVSCLPDGGGFLKARLSGAVQMELAWGNEGTECTGAVRPDGGIRMRFSHADGDGRLVLLFGVAGLREGQSATALPVNVTVIREGLGEFYSTQGDDKCTLDEVRQEPLVGIPHRTRSYRITARGFCTHPARAVRGEGVILMSRFDYVGRVDFDSEDLDPEDEPLMAHDSGSTPSSRIPWGSMP